MFYTLAGALIGGVVTYVTAKVFNVNFSDTHWLVPTEGAVMTFFGTLTGAAVGMGWGLSALRSGTYLG